MEASEMLLSSHRFLFIYLLLYFLFMYFPISSYSFLIKEYHFISRACTLSLSLSKLVFWPLASVFPTRMGRAPRFVIVGFAEHEPVFTTD